jgi:putative phosphoesterase
MSSYAIISDAHGNIDALKSVWQSITSLGLDEHLILNAGDSVAYGTHSDLCVEFMIGHPEIVSVGGNYDYHVAEYPVKKAKLEQKWRSARPDKLLSIQAASLQLSEPQRSWLLRLPKLLELQLDGLRVCLCHYSPVGKKIGLAQWSSDEDLYGIAQACMYDVIVTGHTHSPFVRRSGRTLFINPGSAGLSIAPAPFAVLTIENGEAKGELLR